MVGATAVIDSGGPASGVGLLAASWRGIVLSHAIGVVPRIAMGHAMDEVCLREPLHHTTDFLLKTVIRS